MSDAPFDISAEEGYLEISITISREHEEILSNFIIEEIAFGLVAEDFNSQVKIICYVPLSSDPEDKIQKIKKYISVMEILPPEQIDKRISSRKIKAIDWILEYQKGFKPVIIDDLVIKTPWNEDEYPGKKIITIEPKMAFGTGKHETTQLCLRAIKQEVGPGTKILDLGTGSGILSIYAAMLGASEILGLDIDPEAVRNAAENALINGVNSIFSTRHGSMEQVEVKKYYDMVISNLIYEGIVKLFDRFVEVSKPGGKMILSGILDSQEAQMTEFIKSRVSADIKIMRQNEWLCYILRMK